MDGRYADCPKITLVCDHLNTHTKGACSTSHRVLPHAETRELAEHRGERTLARQCVRGRRIGDLGTLHDEVSAWSTDVNGTQRGVDWQMKVDDARCKLKSVYPQIMT